MWKVIRIPSLLSGNRHTFTRLTRNVAQESKTWEKKYKRTTRIELEKYWKNEFKGREEKRLSCAAQDNDKKKFYCLSMFPYPSGRLHMGHVRVYTISDAFAHFYRMNGYDVIHPMGWDAFGLPAENAARDRGLDPGGWTRSNISYMKNQLQDLNLSFDWNREFSTCDPVYYKWTQYVFVKLFEAGLAYQKKAMVNWDPVDETVLADEQVDENGCSWRSGALVEKKYLKQWFFKTTDYAQSLLESLDQINEDVGIKAMQRNWIGQIDGCYFNFDLYTLDQKEPMKLPVFCPHPETMYGASHIVIQTKFVEELANEVTSESLKSDLKSHWNALLKSCLVLNPLTNQTLKVVIDDSYENVYTRPTAILAIPSVDDRARSLANDHGFPYKNVISDDGEMVDSGEYSGLDLSDALTSLLQDARDLGISNGIMTSSRLCDWLISRQRYWGTPIPIIHCPQHGPVPVPYDDLPVKLPDLENINLGGVSPLSSVTSWVNTTCPKCGAPAKRETDTMDTFVDSSWYYLRYTDPTNKREPFSKSKADEIMPVDLYIGGKEHATLHLYYARFFSHFLAKEGLHSHPEPFKKILAQGIIKGLTHQIKSTGKYIHSSEVDYSNGKPVVKTTGEEVEATYQKMSKSKLNGVDPEDFVNEWGISITRLYVLYAAAPFEDIHWDVKTDIIPGVMRWQLKAWTCVTRLLAARNTTAESDAKSKKVPATLLQEAENLSYLANKTITDVTNHFKKDCVLSAAITCLMTLVKPLVHTHDDIIALSPDFERAVCALVIMSAPLVPHFASELWSGLQQMPYTLTERDWEKDVLDQAWPKPVMVTDLNLKEFKVKVDNRICYAVRLPPDFDSSEVEESVLDHKKVKKQLKGNVADSFNIDANTHCINITTVPSSH